MKWLIPVLMLGIIPSNLYTASSNAAKSAPNLILLDQIQTVILSPEGRDIITKSDVDRPNIMGTPQTLDDLKFERLVYLDAAKFNFAPTDDMVNKYLAMIAKENNLSVDDLNQVFSSAGFTRQEAEEKLKRIQAMNSMFDFKIRSNLIVPTKAVQAYYDEHPEKEEATYLIEYAQIPRALYDRENLKKQLAVYANTGKGVSLTWSTPIWLKHSEIAPEKMFITRMTPGAVSAPLETADHFEIYRLKDLKKERVKPLDERYKEIVEILRRPKYDELLNAYRNSLFSTDHVRFIEFAEK